jgi:hypothetical protein
MQLRWWYYWHGLRVLFQVAKIGWTSPESRQQESAQAYAKRLLSMACVTAWGVAADNSLEAAELRVFLIER